MSRDLWDNFVETWGIPLLPHSAVTTSKGGHNKEKTAKLAAVVSVCVGTPGVPDRPFLPEVPRTQTVKLHSAAAPA